MLTAQEQAELDALEAELNPQRQPAAPTRTPNDLTHNIQVLTPEEEAELVALEQEFSTRQFQAPGQVEQKGFLTQVGDTIDSYTGAPVRKAFGTLQDTNSLTQAGSAFIDQFGEDPALAPTGKEIATKAGFSPESVLSFEVPIEGAQGRIVPQVGSDKPRMKEEVSPAGVVGLATDMAFDLTNLLPFAGVAIKGTTKGAKFLKGSAKAADVAEEAAKANALVDSAQVLKESGKEAKKSLVKMFKPDLNPDWNDYKRIAQENGIPEDLLNEAHEFGQSSLISRHARSVAEGPLGAEKLARHENFIKKVAEATENKIKQIGNTDVIPDNADAGALIRESFDEGVDRFFNNMGETYQSALKLAPDMRLDKKSGVILNSKLNQMEMWAKKRLGQSKDAEKVLNTATKKGQINKAAGEVLEVEASVNKAITKEELAQAREVLEGVKLAKRALTSSGGDLSQVYSAMRDIGNIAFKKKPGFNAIPSDQKRFQEMYFGLQKGMTESIRTHLGDDFADALIKNNSDMSDFFSKRGVLEKVLGNGDVASEKVFEKLILKGDTKQIDTLFSIISPEAAKKLKASFLNNVVSRNAEGAINFKTTRNTLDKLRKEGKLKTLFKDDELRALDDIMKLGDNAGSPVMSTSGTSAGNAFRDILSTLKNKVEGDILVENLKNGARKRANYVENVAESGKPKSGLSLLKEKSPVTKGQAAQGVRVNSVQERNERLEKYKKMRGL